MPYSYKQIIDNLLYRFQWIFMFFKILHIGSFVKVNFDIGIKVSFQCNLYKS